MIDERIIKYAKTLINYSLEVKKGNLVFIQAYEAAMPLVRECYRQVVRAGAHPHVVLMHDLNEILYKEGSDEQISYISPITRERYLKADKLLNIRGGNNTRYLSGVNPEKIALSRKASGGLVDIYMDRVAKGELDWTLCMYPTQSAAQEANMSLDEYTDFIFDACLLNEKDPIQAWKNVHKEQEKMIEYLSNKKELRIVSEDTDVSMKIEGRKWINSDGHNNFPSGEVFTAPIEDSVNGKIRFSFPGIYAGQEIEDIKLTFVDGKVTEASAAKGEELLKALLDTDKGARYLGEVAIGTNYGIKKFTRNMLFDEKIGGTVHLAIGKAYPESGGINKSAIHWDMLCDMKNGGEIYADGELFYKDGNPIVD